MDQAKATPEDRKAALMAQEADRSPKAYVDEGVRLVSEKDAPDVEQPGIEVHKTKGRSKFSAVIIDKTRLLNAPPVEEEELTDEELKYIDLDRYVKEVLPREAKVPMKQVAERAGVPLWMMEQGALKKIHKDIDRGLNEVQISDQNAMVLSEVRDLFDRDQGDDVTNVLGLVTKEQRKDAKILWDKGWSYIRIAKDLRITLPITKLVLLCEGVKPTGRF